MNLTQLKGFFQPSQSQKMPQPGIYHFTNEKDSARNRIHLRIDTDGNSLLMINAARAYHLNPTATAMAYWSLQKLDKNTIEASLQKNFSVEKEQIQQDLLPFLDQLSIITDPEDACPVCELDLDLDLPFSHTPSAPYRMDLAITYRCNNECLHCYNARSRDFHELDTKSWFKIIDRLWELGIPHIVFTGGEPTLRDDLPELIAYAEQKGQITGINTNGRKLSDPTYLARLIKAGLDHIQITFESHKPEIHDLMVNARGAWQETVEGIRNAVSQDIYMMTNTTMLTINYDHIAETLDYLADLNVPTVGLNALIYAGKGKDAGTGLPERKLQQLLDIAKQKTTQNHQKLIWYTPTQYCRFNPIQNDLGVKGCSAALYNMCIEPDGAVLPCQSYYQPMGNMLTDDWNTIWNHDLALSLRERKNLPKKCSGCDLVVECGGGCPLTYQVSQTH